MAENRTSEGAVDSEQFHAGLIKLVWRMSFFYLIVGGSTAVVLLSFPNLLQWLPVGGLTDYISPTFEAIQGRLEPPDRTWTFDALSLFLAMTATLILMVPVAWVFKAIHQGQHYDHSIDETALVLPAVVAGVVSVAQQSLALAFSLAGVVAAIRFRRALSDTFDTLFIFVAIGVGLAAGVGAIEVAIVITVFFNYATALVSIFGDGLESKNLAEMEMRRAQEKKRARRKAKAKKKRAAQKQAVAELAASEDEAPVVTSPLAAASGVVSANVSGGPADRESVTTDGQRDVDR